MPRGRRPRGLDASTIEEQLQDLKRRQAELRQQLRRMRNSETEVGKLREKLEKQFATAKWTVNQIRELNPHWDDIGFYNSVEARQPTPRGRRPRKPAAGGGA